ncbi:TauD/TfdA family dioxygenase [Actinacidiphila rubida]|uniref:Taurine dioxygenase, alpha-ketoglutarate-dependent n=1 Tax=Actinacidiphila rubida TaxID=310780 RepID=A0A1H8KAV6_9ACTN|nr:TauD/TfdA family dioxygenase [Actinacidiphila rubida]SEN89995.1 Taurine dioxygenase, alpha-ketoglutarate-dependent [Actinacidiphila rubida]
MLTWEITPGSPATTHAAGLGSMDGAAAWLRRNLPEVQAALHTHGTVFLRGLPVATVEDVAAVRDILIPESTPYREKATPRSDFGHGVASSTDLPPSQSIRMHNENSYTLTFPGKLLFACLVEPPVGGATPVADCRAVLRNLPERIADRMRSHGWSLTRTYSPYVSLDWRSAFGTDDPAEVAAYCAENHIAVDWLEDGRLRTRQLRSGTLSHPTTGEEVWFNHLAFWNEWSLQEDIRTALTEEFGPDGLPFNTGFGDGEPLTREDVDLINAAYDAATVRRTWQRGDVMLVDNILCAHGRDPFSGDRKIAVAMGEPIDLMDCRPSVHPVAAAV